MNARDERPLSGKQIHERVCEFKRKHDSKKPELVRVELRRLHERYVKQCQRDRSMAREVKYQERRVQG